VAIVVAIAIILTIIVTIVVTFVITIIMAIVMAIMVAHGGHCHNHCHSSVGLTFVFISSIDRNSTFVPSNNFARTILPYAYKKSRKL
jgi:hypothetical protein